jgi:hypothetical protein
MSVFSNKKTLPKSILSSPIKATTAKTTTATLTESSWNKSPTNRGVRKTTTFLSAESKKPNKWNIFRSKHAGQGLTMAQLSARYHKQNDSDSNSEDSEDDEEEDSEDDEEEDGEDDEEEDGEDDEEEEPDNHGKKKRKKRNEKITAYALLAAAAGYLGWTIVDWVQNTVLLASKVFAFIVGISASLIALLKAYDRYYIRYTQFANYNKLSDANLKKQIAKLEKERCWWTTGRPPGHFRTKLKKKSNEIL